MSEKDAQQQQQQFSMVPLESDPQTARNSSSSSTTPVHQVDTTTETDNGDLTPTPAQCTKDSWPQFFVLPHLLKKNAWILLAATTFVMLVYIWLYLGSLWSPMSRVKNVEIVFYNADKGFDYTQTPAPLAQLFQTITHNNSMGAMIQNQIMDPQGQLNHIFSWIDKTNEEGWDRDALVEHVEKARTWGLLYIPANFSNNFLSYAPSTTTGPATAATLKTLDMEYSIMNPVLVYGQNFATYVVFIVLYIGSMLAVYSICKYLPNTIETIGVLTFGNETNEPIRKSSQIPKFPAIRIVLARHAVAMLFSLVHTIAIWMVPQVLHGHQMSEHFNGGIAFAFIWFAGVSFISILFLLSHLLTVDGFQGPATMLMILMFTSSGGILDWVIMPGFFRVGKIFPFTYGVRGLRAIYFGSLRQEMWINWLVILAWIVIPGISTLFLARSEIRLRRENMRRTHSIQPQQV
ncbi:hypothetical protein BGZ95_000819 [Linnemannia exigua]|uniref:DUF3533 domain-containing protein n=1 Tax=Linnemannia exigua TaxID=604196 RepID=A0AAD4DJ61_9FUNG|nr:hypothetical protein BGZ95_000819 [Linnemannia exigua]